MKQEAFVGTDPRVCPNQIEGRTRGSAPTKSIFVLLTSCFAFFSLLLPSPAHTLDLDSKAKEVEAKYKQISTLKADFTQMTFVELLEKNVEKRGTMSLSKGSKFKIEYTGEDEKTYLSDGESLWIYIPYDPTTLEAYSLKNSGIPQLTLSLLENFGNLRRLFFVKESNDFESQEGQFQMTLTPKKKKSGYKKISVLLNSEDKPLRLKVFNESGNVSEYILSYIRFDEPISGTTFINPF